MRFLEEIAERVAVHRRATLEAERGPMSEEAFAELRNAVTADMASYLTDPSDCAIKTVYDALIADDAARSEEEFLDDASYEAAREKRYARLQAACTAALALDEHCLDAQQVLIMTNGHEPYKTLASLREFAETMGEVPTDALMRRPYLRVLAATARLELECACYKRARAAAEQLIKLDPTDELGARYTLAIALARLEDEAALNTLDARFAHSGNAWMHLARTVLMFKLDRMDAARRALRGYTSLCRGGAYALLRPVFVETYIPQRPLFEPGSFEEAVLAVRECDPIIMDTPDFLAWAAAQDDFSQQAQAFARKNDLDW